MERQQRASIFPGIIKTSLWLCAFLAFGWLVGSALFKGKSGQVGAGSSVGNNGWVVGEKSPRVKELSKQYRAVNFDDLSDYYYYWPAPGETPDAAMVKKSKIPDDIKALNGQKMAISGFMIPTNASPDGATEFVLNGNADMCGFGGPTLINQWMMVRYEGKGKVPFTHLPMTVFGTLEVGEEYRDGHLYSLYRMKADAVSMAKGVVE